MLRINNQLGKAFEITSLVTKITGERTLFHASYFGIVNFEKHSERMAENLIQGKAALQQSVRKSLQSRNAKLFTDDIKNLVYLTDTKSDFTLLADAVRKYHKQTDSSVFDYNFGAPLIRRAYVNNEVDQMLELFMNDENTFLYEKTRKPGQMVLNKLYEDKRYDDVLKVHEKIFERDLEESKKNSTPIIGRYVETQIAFEALYEKNDSTALDQAKELYRNLSANEIVIHRFSANVAFLLATQQSDYEFANEVLTNRLNEADNARLQSTVIPAERNLTVINLLNSNKVSEALNEIEQIRDDRVHSKKFFQETITLLKEIKLEDAGLQDKLDTIISQLNSNQIFDIDMKNFFIPLVTISPRDRKKLEERNDRFGAFRSQTNNPSFYVGQKRPFNQ